MKKTTITISFVPEPQAVREATTMAPAKTNASDFFMFSSSFLFILQYTKALKQRFYIMINDLREKVNSFSLFSCVRTGFHCHSSAV